MTENDLDEARVLAHKLIDMRGEVTAASDDGSYHVDRVNKLLTLYIRTQREIKLFAEIAFYDENEYCYSLYSNRIHFVKYHQQNPTCCNILIVATKVLIKVLI